MIVADRGSYFFLEVKIDTVYGIDFNVLEERIEINIDIILASMTATNNLYKFKNRNKFIYLFSTSTRKRKGQLVKLVEKNLVKNGLVTEYDIIPFLKTEFTFALHELKRKRGAGLELVNQPVQFEGYSGRDLEFFKDKSKWHPWQTELYDELFHKSGQIKYPDPRKITFIYDEEGNSGKSSFYKYLFYHNPEDIGRITYGSTSQLRSALVNMGKKRIYMIDLTRSKGRFEDPEDLIAGLEDAKNGIVSTMMYGSGSTLLMDIPHVIVSSSYKFDHLSMNRWKILRIKNNQFIDITKE